MSTSRRPIATINEGPLHAALKSWYALPGDQTEVPVDGRQIDLVRGDLLIEIQTRGFSSLRAKLKHLLACHSVRLVYPLTIQKWIVRVQGRPGKVLGRRKSPQAGRLEDVFRELVSLAEILAHPRFALEVLLTREDEVRVHVAGRAWRRKGWTTVERRLVEVADRRLFGRPGDWLQFLPSDLPVTFSTADIARELQVSRDLAQKIAYCLRGAGVIGVAGKQRNALVYSISCPPPPSRSAAS